MSLRALSGVIFTTLRAGFALNVVSSPVKGLIPLRSFVAGLRTTLILERPGIVKQSRYFLLAQAVGVGQCREDFRLGHGLLAARRFRLFLRHFGKPFSEGMQYA